MGPLLTLKVHEALRNAARTGVAAVECSLDLDRSTTSVEVSTDYSRWQGARYPCLQASKDRTIYYWAGQGFAPVARYTNSLIKLVPTQWGAPTFDVWVTRKDFAKADPNTVAAFVRVTLAAQQRWRQDGAHWAAGSREADEVAAITGVRAEGVVKLLGSNEYPDAAAQASPALLGGGLASGLAGHLASTAGFLRAQGKVDRILPSYAPFVDPQYVRRAALAGGA